MLKGLEEMLHLPGLSSFSLATILGEFIFPATGKPLDAWIWGIVILIAVIGFIAGILSAGLLNSTLAGVLRVLTGWLGRFGLAWGFRRRYLTYLIEDFHGLNIRGIKTRAPVVVDLEQVYVSLSAQVPDEILGRQRPPPMSISQAMRQHQRLVILGGPGTGKSTLLVYLTLSYARKENESRLGMKDNLLPIYMPLRGLKDVLDSDNRSLPAYLDAWYTKIGMTPKPGFFENALRRGRCLVMLDGLDEVADEVERRLVSEWVDRLVSVYPANRYIVTSRPLGYETAPLSNDFAVLRVQDFGVQDIRQFVGGWCLAVEIAARGEDNATARQRAQQASDNLIDAIEANEAIRRLAVNPLLLSIIALVHRYRATLPKRRVDLYAECVDVLLGHWDEAKGLAGRLSPSEKRVVLQGLALEMHRRMQREIAYHDLVQQVGELMPKVGGRAEDAHDFVEEIRERSGLLIEMGLGQYGFASIMFQEYLCARELVENESKRGLLFQELGNGWWREVLLDYVGMIDATPVIEQLLTTDNDIGHSQLLLAGQCLVEAIRVENAVREKVVRRLKDVFSTSTGRLFLEAGQLLAGIGGEQSVGFFLRIARDDPDRHEIALWSLEQMSQQPNEVLREQVYAQILRHLQIQELHKEAFIVLTRVWGIDRIAAELYERLSLSAFEQTISLSAEMMDSTMITIPAGDFLIGDEKKRVYTSGFQIDKYVVTNAQYGRFIKASGHRPPVHWRGGSYSPERAFHPVVQVSWHDAVAYAQWAGKRLPTEVEWEKAARGTDGQIYPWGNQWDAKRCNNGESSIRDTTPVGKYSPEGDSPFGCVDMVGNVWEWCLDSSEGGLRVIRGGSWISDALEVRCSSRKLVDSKSIGTDRGFRLLSEARRVDPEAARIAGQVKMFFTQAGFSLELISEASVYRCESPRLLGRILPSEVYIWIHPGEALGAEHVRDIYATVRRIDAGATHTLVIVAHRPTGEGWAQIGTLRMEGFTVLPIESSLLREGVVAGHEASLLQREIEKRLGTDYDPYDIRDPVAGAFGFFGRDALVKDLLRRMVEGRPIGIFGLRKLGKSSLLQALGCSVPFPVALVNLQTVGHAELDELYKRILQYWARWVQGRMRIDVILPVITKTDPTGSFVAATLELLKQLEQHCEMPKLALFLDEVELIVPKSDGDRASLERYLVFLRGLRGGLIDEDGSLSLVVASLNPSLNRINAWGAEQNPTFNLFQEIYLGPLAREDCIQMVHNIGRQVGLVYDDASTKAIADLSGGHPFLARQLCSLLYRLRDRQQGQIQDKEILLAVEHFIYDEQMVTHLDAGIWQDAGNVALWGETLAQINQTLLLELARADDGIVPKETLLNRPDADLRRTALINLERFHFIHEPESGCCALRYGLLRTWLRRRKLGSE